MIVSNNQWMELLHYSPAIKIIMALSTGKNRLNQNLEREICVTSVSLKLPADSFVQDNLFTMAADF